MPDYKILLGFATIAIGIVSYSFYFRGMIKGTTKPDAFSWLIWGLLAAITFFAQISANGGPGAWATGLTAIACMAIAITAFIRHDGGIKRIDEISLGGAFIGVALWRYTNDPLTAVIVVIAVGVLGFAPTFKNAFREPEREAAITYVLNACKFALALGALASFAPAAWLYPAAMIVMNISLAATLLIERRRVEA